MGFSLDLSVPVLTVFLQGLLSFFSPCVLPLLPLYIGYLSGGTGKQGEDGKIRYDQKKVMVHTLFFVVGISFAFFVLGLGSSALGRFFRGNQVMFARVGGLFVMAVGLYQLGVFGTSGFLSRERRLPVSVDAAAMSPFTAFLLGFTFSFAWTPCVGPALASVLLMAASASTQAKGFLLIGVYTAGFVLPFLAVGAFSASLLSLFKCYGRVVTYTVKAGAVLMILMGAMMFTGRMNSVTGYLSAAPEGTAREGVSGQTGESAADGFVEQRAAGTEAGEGRENGPAGIGDGQGNGSAEAGESAQGADAAGAEPESESQADPTLLPAIDFTLKDQYGNVHTFSDYKGKTVFLNFWATWCPPCRRELPDIQKLYEEYQAEEDQEVIIMGIAAPNFGQEKTEEEICEFLEENGYTYPVVMDTTGEVFMGYGIFSYPTTIMVDRDGNVFGYATGQLSESMMRSIIDQTITGVRASGN